MNNRRIWIPQLIGIIMLLWALNPNNPYGYYIVLRFVLCAISTYLAFNALELEKKAWIWVFGVTAMIYNPIIRVHLTRDIWFVVNIATIIILIISFIIFRKQNKINSH